MRKHTKCKELAQSAITEFATNFLSLQPLFNKKATSRRRLHVMKGMHLNGAKRLEKKRWLTKCLKKKMEKGKRDIAI